MRRYVHSDSEEEDPDYVPPKPAPNGPVRSALQRTDKGASMLILGAQSASKGTVSDVTLTHLIPVLAGAAHGAVYALSDDLTATQDALGAGAPVYDSLKDAILQIQTAIQGLRENRVFMAAQGSHPADSAALPAHHCLEFWRLIAGCYGKAAGLGARQQWIFFEANKLSARRASYERLVSERYLMLDEAAVMLDSLAQDMRAQLSSFIRINNKRVNTVMRYGGGTTYAPVDVPGLFFGVLQKLDESYRGPSGWSYLPPQPTQSFSAPAPTHGVASNMPPPAPRRPAQTPSASLVSGAGSGGQRRPPAPPNDAQRRARVREEEYEALVTTLTDPASDHIKRYRAMRRAVCGYHLKGLGCPQPPEHCTRSHLSDAQLQALSATPAELAEFKSKVALNAPKASRG